MRVLATAEDPTVVGNQVAGGLPEWMVRRVTQYIRENLRRELRIAEISAVVHMSPFHFARLFKRSAGVSPHQFVLQQRIEQATILLTAPTPPVAEVARLVGFGTPSHFAAAFRRMTGTTASIYRGGQCGSVPARTIGARPAAAAVNALAATGPMAGEQATGEILAEVG